MSWVRLDGAENCVGTAELARAVEGELGRSIFVPPAQAELAVEGRAEHVDGRWRAVLRLTDASGQVLGDRVVESATETCEELGRVTATTIALMIDPIGGEEPEVVPVVPPAPRWTFVVDAALTGGAGTVPGVGLGGMAAIAARPPRFVPIVAQGELIPFARVEVGAGHVDLTRMVGGAQICPLAIGAAVSLDLCVGVDAGVVFVLDSTESLVATEFALVQAHGAANLRIRVFGPLRVLVGAHPIVPLRTVAFATREGVEVYRPAPVAGYLDLGLALTF